MIRTTRSLRGQYTQGFLYLFILMIFLLLAAVFIMDIAAKPSHTSIATTKTTPRSNSFLMYENNSTLGIKIQYPTNWEKDSYKDKVIFFAPSLAEGHGTIVPVGLFVKISNLPFQIESLDDYISYYVNKLKEGPQISQPIRVSLTALAGNLAHNITYSARLNQYKYSTTDLIMLSGLKQYEITYYIAEGHVKSSTYLPTIQKMIDSFKVNPGITVGSPFLTYENNSTLGIKIQYPPNWKRTEFGNGVLFLSPSESKSDKVLENLSIRVYPSNNMPLSKLANQSINYYRQNYNDFRLLESKLTTFNGTSAYIMNYIYTDMLFGKGMGIDIGTMTANKVYVISFFAEPAKLPYYLPIFQKMIDSFEIKNNVSNRSSNFVRETILI